MSSYVKVLGIAAFAIVDVLIIAWLLTRGPAPDADGGQDTVGQASPVKERPPVDESVSLTRSESFTLFRIHRSDCSGDTIPKLEMSTNAAEEFREVGLPVDGDELAIRSVLAVAATSPDDLTLLAADPECDKKGFASKDGGESWKRADVKFDWYIAPDDKSVTSPDRTSSPNCSPVALDFTDEANAKVVCKSGSLNGTSNGGATWLELGKLPGIRAASFVGLRTGVAIAATKDCKSQAYRSEDAGASWTKVACIDPKAEAQSLVGGAVKMFATDGDRTWLSEDLGDKWSGVGTQE
jgi:hypothetical protein